MDNFEKYIEDNKGYIKSLSDKTYADFSWGYESKLHFSFDYGDIRRDICFARLFSQMETKQFSSNYFLRLPYKKDDDLDFVDKTYLNYTKILEEIKDLVYDYFDVEIHKTGYKNLKLITFTNKNEIDKDLDYSITLILFCILRTMDMEYFNVWMRENKDIPQTLKDLIYEFSHRTEGNLGHDINDNLANFFKKLDGRNKYKKRLKNLICGEYINKLKQTFGKNGVINNKNYIPYFKKFYTNNGRWGHVMQTDCYNFIEQTTNKILTEENL